MRRIRPVNWPPIQEFPGGHEVQLESVPGCICQYVAVFVSTWLYSSVPGCIRQYVAVFVSTSLYS